MSKRTADTKLDQDNWDADDDENEEAGTFNPVSDAELKSRVIRKAKRSLGGATTSNNQLQGASPFASFAGFGGTSTPFSLMKKSDVFSGQSPINKVAESTVKIENGKTDKEPEKSTKEAQVTSTIASKATRGIEYYRQLQSLNESVLKWMQLHLSKNACSDFTPVFNDYKKHMDTLNVTYPVKKKEGTINEDKGNSFFKSPSSSVEKKEKVVDSNGKSDFNFKNTKTDDETDYGANFSARTTNTSSFSFGMKSTPTATSSVTPSGPASSSKEDEKPPEQKPFQFSFSTKPSDQNAPKGFSFASAIASAKNSSNAGETEEKDYEPPKNEFKKVAEEDAIYSKRCKLFFKKDSEFKDKGVGTLYLKSLEGKTQLLIRADTNLGNILLNIMLSASLPMSRTGKNNVMLVCVPNPPFNEKKPDEAIPMLIRVKTAEDADEVLEIFNKHKS